MIEYITENATQLIQTLIQICGAFAVIATLTPNTSDNAIADFLLKLVNGLGANFGKASNK